VEKPDRRQVILDRLLGYSCLAAVINIGLQVF
jgi:hypothetical protein